MSILLQKMTESEFKEYFNHYCSRLSEDIAVIGDWTTDEAQKIAKLQLNTILSNGLDTKEHYLFSLFHQKLKMAVGTLWLQIEENKLFKKGILYDIEIFDIFRRKGFAKETHKALEEWLKSLQVISLSFHVYATNKIARDMYVNLGYSDMSYNMEKTLLGTEQILNTSISLKSAISLKKMSQDDFNSYFEYKIKDYALENIKAGHWEESEALEKSRQQVTELLPAGLETKGQFIFSVFDPTLGINVGVLWILFTEKKKLNYAFIYDIEIYESQRGKGLSKIALALLEEWCRTKNVSKIGLHVFAKNSIARNLYKKFGYVVTNYNMTKDFE